MSLPIKNLNQYLIGPPQGLQKSKTSELFFPPFFLLLLLLDPGPAKNNFNIRIRNKHPEPVTLLENKRGRQTYLHGRERVRRVKNSHLLEYLKQGSLVTRHYQPGADVHKMIHIGHLVKGSVRQEGPEVARGHAGRPKVADERLSLGGAPEFGENECNGLWSWRHRGECVLRSLVSITEILRH